MAARKRIAAAFDPEAFLKSSGIAGKVRKYPPDAVVFSQGDACNSVYYIQRGTVKLSVLASTGKEAVVGILGPEAFFGEGALADQPVRLATATALTACALVLVPRRQMTRLLHQRNMRIEADLIDQLFNSSEKRLARTLLLLARYGQVNPQRKLPQISQETLAEMIGATRSRVNFFMNKFRKLGFIEYNGGLRIHNSLLSVVLHE
ncbi:MAG: Crp/Fnr family transcriptional regulator [Acidobacteria bacterium]|nr:MAG: Crp/Fnr family transcriptional regulator [Acidobacteriota bacterium]